MSCEDAEKLKLKNGDAVILKNELGSFSGKVYIAPINPGKKADSLARSEYIIG